MYEYKIIDEFQCKHIHVIVLDRPFVDYDTDEYVYIDGEKYKCTPNSVLQWMQLPDVYKSFEGKTAVFYPRKKQ